MQRFKNIIKNILWVTLPAILFCLVIAEVVFRFIIPACEHPLYSYDEHFKLLHLQPASSGLFTAGKFAEVRGRWRSNNFGWNSEIDYIPGIGKERPLVAVIGDSYVEAMQVDVDRRFPALLQSLMGDDFLVYSFGISGAALSQYLHMSRYANQVFNPRILVINVVHNDFDESLANLVRVPRFLQIAMQNGAFIEVAPTPFQQGTFTRICHLSAVVRYLVQNCELYNLFDKIDLLLNPPQKLPNYNANIDVDAVARQRDLIRRGARFLVATIRAENPDKRVIIQMDGPRFDIYNNNLANSNVWWLHEIMRDACRDNRIEFLDLTEPFAGHFKVFREHFENQADWHWNKLGHEVVARALYNRLKETGVLSRSQ